MIELELIKNKRQTHKFRTVVSTKGKAVSPSPVQLTERTSCLLSTVHSQPVGYLSLGQGPPVTAPIKLRNSATNNNNIA